MFHRILVGFDGTPAARSALRFATLLAAPDATITVATVAVERLATGLATEIDVATGLADSERVLLDEARDLLGRRAGVSYQAPVGPSVGSALHTIASDDESDLIVVGSSRHHGMRRIVAGRDPEETFDRAPCAVCVVPPTATTTIRQIASAFDGSGRSQSATDVGSALADGTDATFTVLTVLHSKRPSVAHERDDQLPYRAQRRLDDEVNRLHRTADTDTVLRHGDRAEQLLLAADSLDLLILGASDRRPALRPLLGSVADRVARRTTCPLLLVPQTPTDAVPLGVVEAPLVRRGVAW